MSDCGDVCSTLHCSDRGFWVSCEGRYWHYVRFLADIWFKVRSDIRSNILIFLQVKFGFALCITQEKNSDIHTFKWISWVYQDWSARVPSTACLKGKLKQSKWKNHWLRVASITGFCCRLLEREREDGGDPHVSRGAQLCAKRSKELWGKIIFFG